MQQQTSDMKSLNYWQAYKSFHYIVLSAVTTPKSRLGNTELEIYFAEIIEEFHLLQVVENWILDRKEGSHLKKLELKFENYDGKTVTYSLDNPVEPVDPELVNEVMDEIIAQDAFTSSGGDLVAKKSARIVDRQVEDIEIY